MNISRGYVRLFRQIDEWEWYDNPYVKAIFLHCLIKANDKAKKWRDLTLKRGQFVTSYEKLAAANGITIQQTRTALKQLQLTNEIEYQSTNQYTVITVKNFNLYQATNIQKTKADNPPTNKPNGGQLTTTNNDIDIDNNIISLSLNKKISKEEREILKNYVKQNNLAKSSVTAYVNAMIRNGDHLEILEQEKAKAERKKQKEIAAAEKIEEIQEDAETKKAAYEKFKKAAKELRKIK
ncbi:MAG: hypothetical protein IKE05_01400 [Clostridia bacterium]|nr:hypothetical protein [Clostridia bacterium]